MAEDAKVELSGVAAGGQPGDMGDRPRVSMDVIMLLEQTLAAAKAGRWHAIGLVTARGSEVMINTAGGMAASIALGAAQMQKQVLESIFRPQEPTVITQPRPKLVT